MTSHTTHQVLGAVQLVCGRSAAGDEGLEHAAHHHRLHVLGHRLVVPRGEVVPEASLVWKQQGGGRDHGSHSGWFSQQGWRTLLTADQLEFKTVSPYNREGKGGQVGQRKGFIKHMGEKQTEKFWVGHKEYMQVIKVC